MLQQSQKAWVEYREWSARLASVEFERGTLYPIIYYSHAAAFNAFRANELRKLKARLEAEEKD